jgi:ribosomal protein S18 acetylase RimI-like enzyme
MLQEGASEAEAPASPTTSTPPVELVEVRGDREPWVPLLLEADEPEPLRRYLDDGDLFEIRAEGETVGVVLLVRDGDGTTTEVKNIALSESHRGRGLGRGALERIVDHAAESGAERVLVGTSEGSAGTIAFYRACGFADAGRRVGFFDSYPEPVMEDGVRSHDMVMFERVLGPRGDGHRDPAR